MAKRWASSRMRWSRYSASDRRGIRTGSACAGHVDLLEPLGQRRHRDLLVEPQLLEHPHGHVELALAAVDQQQLRRVGELARSLGDRLRPLGEVGGEAAGQHLLHGREVVVAGHRA